MSLIRIKENTSIEDVNKWLDVSDEDITYEILYKSSFQLFTEGVALGALRTLIVNKKVVNIQFYKNPDVAEGSNLDNVHPIFKSIFGLELLRLSKTISDHQGNALEVRSILGHKVWSQALRQGGYLGDGKNAYLLSRHDYAIPRCLRQNETLDEFPRFDYFQSRVATFLLALRGYANSISLSERKLIEWLYHIAENKYEHGSFSYQGNEFIDGFKGIVLGKFFFKGINEVERRNDYPEFVKQYIKKLINSGKCPATNFTFNYSTVMDLGDGIQNTLPLMDGHTDFQNLCLAFKDGLTRKTAKMNEKSGYGLGQAILAAAKLNALLHVVSGNIETSVDFSKQYNRTNHDHGEFIFAQPKYLPKKLGTSISIFWLRDSLSSEES